MCSYLLENDKDIINPMYSIAVQWSSEQLVLSVLLSDLLLLMWWYQSFASPSTDLQGRRNWGAQGGGRGHTMGQSNQECKETSRIKCVSYEDKLELRFLHNKGILSAKKLDSLAHKLLLSSSTLSLTIYQVWGFFTFLVDLAYCATCHKLILNGKVLLYITCT